MPKRLIAGSMALLAACSAASAKDSAAKGHDVVEQWCRTCHLRANALWQEEMAPPFELIVTWPGRDRAYFTQFLSGDHFPMTIFRLFDDEKAEVVDYLMALKRRSER